MISGFLHSLIHCQVSLGISIPQCEKYRGKAWPRHQTDFDQEPSPISYMTLGKLFNDFEFSFLISERRLF